MQATISSVTSLLLFGLFGAASSMAQPPADGTDPQSVLYHNATLLNPATEQRITNGWMLVRQGRIVQLGQQGAEPLPGAGRQIDLQDQYVMPGLIDVHLHLTAGPHRVEMQNGSPVVSLKGHDEITRYHAISTLAVGVTTAFSPAGEPEANARYVQQQQAGHWPGPKLHYAGYAFEPTPLEAGSVYPKDEAGWLAEIERQKASGVRALKLYAGLSKTELAMAVRLAKAAGLKTVAHLDSVSWQYAAELGIDKLTHALPTSAELLTGQAQQTYLAERKNPYNTRYIYRWFEAVDYDSAPMQQLFATLARQQTQVDLTLVANELFYFGRELDRLYPEPQMWGFHPENRRRWRSFFAALSYDWQKQELEAAQRQLPKVQQLLLRLYQVGVPLAIGTDLSASGPFYLRELQLSQAAGLSPWQVLQLATVGGARHLDLADTGQLAPGYVADFIVMLADPSQDLSALTGIHTVVQQGKHWSVSELKARLTGLDSVRL
ncbi:amidohydrolase family protein [Rheinheimera sp.]|uniref:amidohydrolase family protein n=1 Tax=Rheinheimera sp. TaxID=1869214 RepID=UPI00307D3B8F